VKRKVFIFNKNAKCANYGVGRYVQQLVACLSECGNYDVFVIEYHTGRQRDVDRKQINGVTYFKIPDADNCSSTRQDEARYEKNLLYLLYSYIPVKETSEVLFHVNSIVGNPFLSIAKQLFNAKIIYTIHYMEWSLDLNGSYILLQKILSHSIKLYGNLFSKVPADIKQQQLMLDICDKLVFVANHSYRTAKKVFEIKADKVCIINNAIQDMYRPISIKEKEEIRNFYSISPDEKIILFVGRLEKAKGLHELIKAFSLVLGRFSNVHLLLAGDGNFSQWIKETATMALKISFLGYLSQQKLEQFYQIADIGVFPSFHEQCSYTVIEMMMFGIPIITTDTAGLSEMMLPENTGLLVHIIEEEEHVRMDEGVLAENILYLLEHSEERERIGNNARKHFLEKYNFPGFKDRLLDLYERVLLIRNETHV
jgi:glycosyltransferase